MKDKIENILGMFFVWSVICLFFSLVFTDCQKQKEYDLRKLQFNCKEQK
jgi:hypothetical protein